ncbi:MAG: hypothetical protein LLF98_10400 [Clostridium sp.]|uniref:hypothetical protein n=1 Tax=Clostridium sp. TaxID=1506 RepID=UPI0025B9CBDA|nr:hypothetical protein [Clostridium sp.]MCE5221648.1 hypothetical protein [Clostridium sp.]
MFDLDIKLFSLLYSCCKSLGNIFGFGAFEGMIMYSSVILLGITEVTNSKKVKKS